MNHPEKHIRLLHILCPTYPSPQSYTNSSQTSTRSSPLQTLVSSSQQTSYASPTTCFLTTNVPQSMQSLIAGELLAPPTARKEHRAWNMQLPTLPTRKHQRCAPYHKNLSPLPSPLCPHCPAGQRLHLWRPLIPCSSKSPQVSDDDLKCIEVVIAHAWELYTHTMYVSGLLNYMVFCDKKNIPEADGAPASQLLLMSFISTLAAAYSGSTISNYVCGIQAWHLIHGVSWRIDKVELDTMLKAAKKLTPPSSKRKKRCPYTIDFILAIRHHLDLSAPMGASVFACLTTCFFATGCIGEFTVQRLDSFNPNIHISCAWVSFDQNREGHKVTVLQIPHTKVSQQGQDICWARQDGPIDPDMALAHHLKVNNPPQEGHLFVY